MFKEKPNSSEIAARTAAFFNDATSHKSHGRRIDREEARAHNVYVDDLEDDQALQDAVLTAYHLATIVSEKTPATKFLWSSHGRAWMKNWAVTPAK